MRLTAECGVRVSFFDGALRECTKKLFDKEETGTTTSANESDGCDCDHSDHITRNYYYWVQF